MKHKSSRPFQVGGFDFSGVRTNWDKGEKNELCKSTELR
jgi:hypothetical protein